MPKFANIGEWVEKRFGSQQKSAEVLKTGQGVISGWINGRNPTDKKWALIVKHGYDGPRPQKGGRKGNFVTREELAEEKGARKAEIEQLRASLEKAFEQIRDLALRLPEESRPKAR